jgi:hypothetical protein
MEAMEFEWDPDKAASNLAKHGVSFQEAATVFAQGEKSICKKNNANKTDDDLRPEYDLSKLKGSPRKTFRALPSGDQPGSFGARRSCGIPDGRCRQPGAQVNNAKSGRPLKKRAVAGRSLRQSGGRSCRYRSARRSPPSRGTKRGDDQSARRFIRARKATAA